MLPVELSLESWLLDTPILPLLPFTLLLGSLYILLGYYGLEILNNTLQANSSHLGLFMPRQYHQQMSWHDYCPIYNPQS